MASQFAKEELNTIQNITKVIGLSKVEGVTSIVIDFKLNVDVTVSKSSGLKKYEFIEEVEFIPGLSKIKEILVKYDLSFVKFQDGLIMFRRSKFYRPLVENKLH